MSDPILMLVASLEERVRDLEKRVRELEVDHTPAPPQTTVAATRPASIGEHRAKERQAILDALAALGWNRLAVAEKLGIPRRTLYRRMIEYGIQDGDTRTGITKREKRRKPRR